MKKRNICMAFALIICCLLSFMAASSVECKAYSYIQFADLNAGNSQLVSDGQSGFYIFDVTGSSVRAKYITEDGVTYGAALTLDAPCISYSAYGGVMYLISRDDANSQSPQLCVTTYDFHSEKIRITYVSGVYIKNQNDFATNGKELFFINAAQKKEIHAYSVQGKKLYTLSCGYNVSQLCYDSAQGTLLALTAGGLQYAKGGRTLSAFQGALPQNSIQTLSGGYLADAKGSVYRYYGSTLTALFHVSFSASGINGARLADTVYFANGRSIDGYAASSGKRTRLAQFSNSFDFLTVSSGQIGAYAAQNSTFYLLTAQDIPFIPVEKPTAPTQGSSQGGSQGGNQGGNQGGASSGSKPSGVISSSAYRMDSGAQIITGIKSGTTVAVFKKNIDYNGFTLLVKKQDGTGKASGNIGTGMHAVFQYPSGSVKAQYRIVIYGDVTGEGNINSRDKSLYMSALLGEESFAFPYNYAADVNKDGTIDAVDLLKAAKLSQ